jgi:hypothetical protein
VKRSVYDLGGARVTATLDAGPRVIGYEQQGRRGPFADLPDTVIDHPSIERFWFIGGHRLWRAPEVPEVTYQPDDQPVAVDLADGRLTMTGAADSDGVVKTLLLTQRDELTIVDHALHNQGGAPVETAAWAITQLEPGGTAIVPFPLEASDADGLLPNRWMTFWPYSDLSDPGVGFHRHELRVGVGPGSEKFKVGQPNRRGWLAYSLGETLFVKWAPTHDDRGGYPHLGSSVECYRDHRFVELESVGRLSLLEPGQTLRHREVWTMIRVGENRLTETLASLPVDPMELTAG